MKKKPLPTELKTYYVKEDNNRNAYVDHHWPITKKKLVRSCSDNVGPTPETLVLDECCTTVNKPTMTYSIVKNSLLTHTEISVSQAV